MDGKLIVNRLKAILGKYVDDFNDVVTVSSLSRSSSTITAVTSAAHGLVTGSYITIRGAKEPITLSSLTRSGNLVTAVSATDHKLSDPSLFSAPNLPLYVTISGADAGYNGTWQLISVPDDNTFVFKITGTPTTPAVTSGYLLLDDYDGYNGYKQVTVVNTTTFTYTTANSNLKTPAQGTIKFVSGTRVDQAATPGRIVEFYSANASGDLKTWAFVTFGRKDIYKDNTIANDIVGSKTKNNSFWYEGTINFSVFVIIPAKNDVLGTAAANLAQSYEKPILKALANYIFDSPFAEAKYQPVTFVGHEPDDYLGSYYSHRFDFLIKGLLQDADVAEINPGVPLQLIDGEILEKDMTYNPTMRS